jgi:hypothetical protein
MRDKHMIKYFHELTDKEWKELKESGKTWAEAAVIYPQPEWCEYPEALAGEMGCWSLVYRMGVSRESCKGCELYNKDTEK